MNSDIRIELVNYQGDDWQICDAARVSFDRDSISGTGSAEEAYERNVKLLNYLAKHNHWSPFAHNSITVRCTAPIFLARQLVKHQVGGVWNEVSRRYVSNDPEYYWPDEFHTKPIHSKQGCGEPFNDVINDRLFGIYRKYCEIADEYYQKFLKEGVAPEEARMVLPLSTLTSWYWTGSLAFFWRVYEQRSDDHAQTVAREFASKLKRVISPLFPEAWSALENAKGIK